MKTLEAQIDSLGDSIKDAMDEIDRLRAVNRELTAALMLLVADVGQYPPWQRPYYALDQARAVLAKAKVQP